MRLARVPIVALVCALTALSSPASADSVGYTGLTCGLASQNDPLFSNPTTQFGTVTFGPWEAGDLVDDPTPGTSHHEPATITWTCLIQINSAVPGANVVATCLGVGYAVAAGACGIVYGPIHWFDSVYVCTSVVMAHDSQVEVFEEDDDPWLGGTQCALATMAQVGNLLTVSRAPRAVAVVG